METKQTRKVTLCPPYSESHNLAANPAGLMLGDSCFPLISTHDPRTPQQEANKNMGVINKMWSLQSERGARNIWRDRREIDNQRGTRNKRQTHLPTVPTASPYNTWDTHQHKKGNIYYLHLTQFSLTVWQQHQKPQILIKKKSSSTAFSCIPFTLSI